MSKTYHICKFNPFKATRLYIQKDWDKKSVFVGVCSDNCRVKEKDWNVEFIKLNFKNLFILSKQASVNDTFVFHMQSSLIYLLYVKFVLFFMWKKINVVYDIHDLHEKPIHTRSIYLLLRFYILLCIEYFVIKILRTKCITVSNGLAKEMSIRYNVDKITVVTNAQKSKIELYPDKKHKTLLYFGEDCRAPDESIIKVCLDNGIKIDLYGIGFDSKKWKMLFDKYSNLKYFGTYSPDDIDFIKEYKIMILLSSVESTNYKYSLPNKLFQSLTKGVSVIMTKNFVEPLELFKDNDCAVLGIEGSSDIVYAVNHLENSYSYSCFKEIEQKLNFMYETSKNNYISLIHRQI